MNYIILVHFRYLTFQAVHLFPSEKWLSVSVEPCSDGIWYILNNFSPFVKINDVGCGRLWVIDGQWKLMFSHCMMQRKVFIQFQQLIILLLLITICIYTQLGDLGVSNYMIGSLYLANEHYSLPTK